ncbi:MAG: sulfite exporter TauE/SafE family protein [Deltaproteobacteria bacterium]|nr:sulfite exporter TauE/SafE family protein [Deltaproteobacteria bacterium]MBI3079203.1 sulfite exporter TauE/SafE family protein [Deltaproteobacteria bacterium]
MPQWLLLLPLGLLVGGYGALVGAGGGFVLMPILLLLYPHESARVLTSISLAVSFCSALSGTGVYAWLRRIDLRSGLLLGVATVPGAALGALASHRVPRGPFDVAFGLLLLGLCLVLLRPPTPGGLILWRGGVQVSRELVDREGRAHRYSFALLPGLLLSLGVGFVASLMGISGGPIQVPLLVVVLGFPVPVATATSLFISSIITAVGTTTHLLVGDFVGAATRTLLLGIGMITGAQVGARLSERVRPRLVLRLLALALALLGARLIVGAF